MQNYVKFRANEWRETYAKASRRFVKEVLGVRPTFETVRKDVANPHVITPLEWAAMAVLVVVAVFTSYKVGALAVPFAENAMQALTQHTYIDPVIQTSFTVVTAILFMLLATPSLIYFKLLDRENEIVTEKLETRSYRWWQMPTLDYLSPRLPYLMVYLSLAWLLYTSSQMPGTPFEQFLPVIAEIALAALVGNILKKRADFNALVYKRLNELQDPYDKRKADHEQDPQFLRMLYQVMREDLAVLKRSDLATRKTVQPNLWIENGSAEDVDAAIVAEYHRNTGGLKFANKVVAEPEVAVAAPVATVATTRRIPPFNKKAWTVEDLVSDFRVRGMKPTDSYNERLLGNDYVDKFKARAAWRNGAKHYFTTVA